MKKEKKFQKKKQEEQLEEVEMIPTPTREDDLFDPEIEFIFYSRSSNSKPGKGKGESLPEDKKSAYKELGVKLKISGKFYLISMLRKK